MASRYRWEDFVLDLDSYRLERAGVPLSLEPKAFNLLVLMIQRPGHLFSKQEIFEALWRDTAVTDHALTRVVAQLRRVLGDEAREARYLETVPTRGYRWIKHVEEGPAPEALGTSREAPSPPGTRAEAPIRLPGLAAAFTLGVAALGFL
ncbi:MAG: winged helix-turn-helix domain-containing protein, partial [Vicinamibacterales bacterium]